MWIDLLSRFYTGPDRQLCYRQEDHSQGQTAAGQERVLVEYTSNFIHLVCEPSIACPRHTLSPSTKDTALLVPMRIESNGCDGGVVVCKLNPSAQSIGPPASLASLWQPVIRIGIIALARLLKTSADARVIALHLVDHVFDPEFVVHGVPSALCEFRVFGNRWTAVVPPLVLES